ncbi:MAG: dTMP kinase [Candidatus Roseilinea sp.]|uniref:dTMP kinase n=1 Tax=Candidatus Roseilinea sp. TaxID=2838777 RepID=UPI004048FCF0
MLITFEGPDGSGKTTQVRRAAEWLASLGYDVLALHEPGGTEIGDRVRAILMDRANTHLDPRAETLLFCASRAQLMAEKVRPHLVRRGIVICDRFTDSTLAYQGYGRGLDLSVLRVLLDFATFGLKPDLTLCLDVDAHTGLQRRASARGEINRLDAEPLAFHERVRAGYLALAAEEPQRWVVIDASAPPEVVERCLRDAISARLGAPGAALGQAA